MMKVGDRVRLSPEGRASLSSEWGLRRTPPIPQEKCAFLLDPESQGVVVRPGLSRGGAYLRVRVDGSKRPVTSATVFWERVEGK